MCIVGERIAVVCVCVCVFIDDVLVAVQHAGQALLDKSWLKGNEQAVVYSAALDCAPLIQLATKEKHSVRRCRHRYLLQC